MANNPRIITSLRDRISADIVVPMENAANALERGDLEDFERIRFEVRDAALALEEHIMELAEPKLELVFWALRQDGPVYDVESSKANLPLLKMRDELKDPLKVVRDDVKSPGAWRHAAERISLVVPGYFPRALKAEREIAEYEAMERLREDG